VQSELLELKKIEQLYAEGNAVGIDPCCDHMVRAMPTVLPSA
jgi:hypothetical protein